MANRIHELFEERGIKVAAFARENNITPSTLYAINDGTTGFDKIGISTFLKIAKGLGMSAEEIYYGTEPRRKYADPQQEELNGHYESMNATGRKLAVDSIKAMSSSPELRAIKEGRSNTDSSAMEA